MNALEETMGEDIKQRVEEIAVIKEIISRTLSSQQSILRKYTIPVFYSLWEGYVKESFEFYIKEINSLDEKYSKKLKNLSIDFNQREQCINDIRQALKNNEMELPVTVSTESNVNLKIVNKLLSRFNLEKLPEERFKKRLDDFLKFRNRISHGETRIPIEQSHIDEFSRLVIELMDEIFLKMSEGYAQKTYRSR